jgi:hypothetical protein
MLVYAYNPNTQQSKSGGYGIQSQPGLTIVRPYLKKSWLTSQGLPQRWKKPSQNSQAILREEYDVSLFPPETFPLLGTSPLQRGEGREVDEPWVATPNEIFAKWKK